MTETRIVIVCNQCGAFWDPAAEPAACTDLSHQHSRFDSHLHRSRVVFLDGTAVTAVSFGSAEPYGREVVPDFGLYLTSHSERASCVLGAVVHMARAGRLDAGAVSGGRHGSTRLSHPRERRHP
jgi:hypothetical protein